MLRDLIGGLCPVTDVGVLQLHHPKVIHVCIDSVAGKDIKKSIVRLRRLGTNLGSIPATCTNLGSISAAGISQWLIFLIAQSNPACGVSEVGFHVILKTHDAGIDRGLVSKFQIRVETIFVNSHQIWPSETSQCMFRSSVRGKLERIMWLY